MRACNFIALDIEYSIERLCHGAFLLLTGPVIDPVMTTFILPVVEKVA